MNIMEKVKTNTSVMYCKIGYEEIYNLTNKSTILSPLHAEYSV